MYMCEYSSESMQDIKMLPGICGRVRRYKCALTRFVCMYLFVHPKATILKLLTGEIRSVSFLLQYNALLGNT